MRSMGFILDQCVHKIQKEERKINCKFLVMMLLPKNDNQCKFCAFLSPKYETFP